MAAPPKLPILCLMAGLLGSAPGCGGEYPDDVGQRSLAVVQGQVDENYTNVGLLTGGPGGNCTATLIGSRTVLTAAHCVSESAATAMTFYLGGKSLSVAAAIRHPDAALDESASVENDVGLVRLAEPVELADAIAPLSNVGPSAGLSVDVVGFGKSEAEDSVGEYTRRLAQNVIKRVGTARFVLTTANNGLGTIGSICAGDSGGPTFAVVQSQRVQIGIHSFLAGGDADAPCGTREGYDFRVDRYTEWIAEMSEGDVTIADLAPYASATDDNGTALDPGDATQNEVTAVACNVAGSPTPPVAAWVLLLLGLAARLGRRSTSRRLI